MEQVRHVLHVIILVVHAKLQDNILIVYLVIRLKIEKILELLEIALVKLVLLTLEFRNVKIIVEMELSKIPLLLIVMMVIRITMMDVQAIVNGSNIFIVLTHFILNVFTMGVMVL